MPAVRFQTDLSYKVMKGYSCCIRSKKRILTSKEVKRTWETSFRSALGSSLHPSSPPSTLSNTFPNILLKIHHCLGWERKVISYTNITGKVLTRLSSIVACRHKSWCDEISVRVSLRVAAPSPRRRKLPLSRFSFVGGRVQLHVSYVRVLKKRTEELKNTSTEWLSTCRQANNCLAFRKLPTLFFHCNVHLYSLNHSLAHSIWWNKDTYIGICMTESIAKLIMIPDSWKLEDSLNLQISAP